MPFAVWLSFLLLVAFACSSLAKSIYELDDGALYLTPIIRSGRLEAARALAKVESNDWTIKSYSGYLTVDDVHDSNIFFWFIPAIERPTDDAPVLLWLQGGPGSTSLYGAFEEHGPFSITRDKTVKMRADTWAFTHSMLYVDNPVGAGFSFTGDDAGYSFNQMAVSRNMYEALVQFFTLFPEYQKNDFYVTGESYAGKYAPAVSYAIHSNNPSASVKINLKGLAIGNGLVDPVNQMVYSEFLYQHGFVDESGKKQFENKECLVRDRINAKDFIGALLVFCDMVLNDRDSLFLNLTGLSSQYNMQWEGKKMLNAEWMEYVNATATRRALHVGVRPLNSPVKVFNHLADDIMRSTKQWLSALVDDGKYRVLLYSGQLDMLVPYRGTMNMARSLRWTGAEHFRNATRTVWWVPVQNSVRSAYNTVQSVTSVAAGYATSYGPLTVLMVRNAGHMVPLDQPSRALKMINHFTSNQSFSDPITV
ncbi:Serine carboxypeptidase, serine active site,Serine carboxypeptidases, histidine active [Cinara cedri]|uniref:Carboxypeptidase n=1 Tax=Cinara cedri TaxID=506608 RepID=A0A5E4ME40_9HEMI|nr:Serine carboxypeptidase, serine active site,Serine carboxypeptidases, histidine active [Cinara cedri]